MCIFLEFFWVFDLIDTFWNSEIFRNSFFFLHFFFCSAKIWIFRSLFCFIRSAAVIVSIISVTFFVWNIWNWCAHSYFVLLLFRCRMSQGQNTTSWLEMWRCEENVAFKIFFSKRFCLCSCFKRHDMHVSMHKVLWLKLKATIFFFKI
jgi:hypothetical protein